MFEYAYIFIYTAIIIFFTICSWYRLLNKKINFNNHKFYVAFIGMSFITFLNILIINNFLRVLISTIILMFFFKYLFKEKIHKCIITPIFTQLIIFILEFIYVFGLSLFMNKSADELFVTKLSIIIENIVISICLIASVRFKFIRNLYIKFLNVTNKIKSIQLSLFCVIGMFILNIFLANSYYKIQFHYFLIMNVTMIIFVLFIILYSFRTQNKYNKVSDKYNIAIKSLNDYEDMMTKYRIANHENKNLLLTVRAMVLNKDKNIPEYIDSIIEQKYMDDEKLLFEMSVIPSGGLRATIYSEILKIKESEINYSLNIDRKIKTIDLINLETETIVEICKIIGVFIDNSIEAVKKLRKKNIDIQLYFDNKNLYIKVSNNYKGNIDVLKINNEGYTTKGKGHGYGLALVKRIVDNNSLFDNRTEISKNTFSQILIIKYKKTH